MSLLKLPDELLQLILVHCNYKEDESTTLALRGTCRRTYHVADPLVWCVIENDDPGRGYEDPTETVRRWAWKLARRPELSRFIKVIRLKDWNSRIADYADPAFEEPPWLGLFEQALERCDLFPNARKMLWEQLSFEPQPITHLKFLLTMCSNVEIVAIPEEFVIPQSVLTWLLLRNAGESLSLVPDTPSTSSAFQSLRELAIGEPVYSTNLTNALWLTTLPNLQVLKIFRLLDLDVTTSPESYKPQPRSLRPLHIVLDDCVLDSGGLERLLASCTRLRALSIRWSADHVTHASVGEALRRYGGRLEHVHIDTTEIWRTLVKGTPRWFGSLTSLKYLRTLAIPMSAMSSTDPLAESLPPALEELYVLGDTDTPAQKQDEKRISKLTNARIELPSLKKVSILPWTMECRRLWWGTSQSYYVDYGTVQGFPLKFKRR